MFTIINLKEKNSIIILNKRKEEDKKTVLITINY